MLNKVVVVFDYFLYAPLIFVVDNVALHVFVYGFFVCFVGLFASGVDA